MKKIAVVIFSRNAQNNTNWGKVLQSYAEQDISALRILTDSGSTDSTVAEAKRYGWQICHEDPDKFNHGLTRNRIAEKLLKDDFDIAIFATQDVVLASNDTLTQLVNGLLKENAAVAYARQIPLTDKGMDSFFRRLNYPDVSMVKTSESIGELGLMTPFCSDSLAAWDLKKVAAAGGFPETDFGEDMLLGAKFIMSGEKILYCAESKCFHQHNDNLKELFKRGIAIGRLHARHPELRRDFGKAESCAAKRIPLKIKLRYFPQLAIKYLGYIIGKRSCK